MRDVLDEPQHHEHGQDEQDQPDDSPQQEIAAATAAGPLHVAVLTSGGRARTRPGPLRLRPQGPPGQGDRPVVLLPPGPVEQPLPRRPAQRGPDGADPLRHVPAVDPARRRPQAAVGEDPGDGVAVAERWPALRRGQQREEDPGHLHPGVAVVQQARGQRVGILLVRGEPARQLRPQQAPLVLPQQPQLLARAAQVRDGRGQVLPVALADPVLVEAQLTVGPLDVGRLHPAGRRQRDAVLAGELDEEAVGPGDLRQVLRAQLGRVLGAGALHQPPELGRGRCERDVEQRLQRRRELPGVARLARGPQLPEDLLGGQPDEREPLGDLVGAELRGVPVGRQPVPALPVERA
ncbi:hypothetical protein [Ornithinimicrobium kibberense]|uniref:hypothetical protein n=1 Tax=Ornithinimicrobium kibberense TaxID=282060 RepID=UPI0036109E86